MKYLKMVSRKTLLFCILLLAGITGSAQVSGLEKFFNESHAAVDKENYEQALIPLLHVLDKDPTNLQGLDEITLVYDKLKNYKAASITSKQMAGLQPGSANYQNNAGWFLMLNKEYSEAEKYYLGALELNDCSYSIYLNLGHVYAFLRQEDKCREYYKKAASYIPNREAYEKGILADFELLKKEGNFPYNTEEYKNMFINYFNTEYVTKSFGSETLDSIYRLTTYDNYSIHDPAILALKERFLLEEIKNETWRLYVMRDFYWNLGWLHFNTGSREIAIDKYFIKVIQTSYEIRDTGFVIEVLYKMGNANPGGSALIRQALNLAVLTKNFNKQYLINLLVGDKFKAAIQPDSALPYFRNNYYLADISEVLNAKRTAINRLMLVFGQMKQFDSVNYYYALAKQLTNKAPDLKTEFMDDLNYCGLLKSCGKQAEAIIKGKEFIRIYEDKKNIEVSAMYEKVGLAYFQMSLPDSAAAYLREATRSYTIYIQNNPGTEHEFPVKERMQSFIHLKRMALARNNINEMFDLSEQCKANILYTKLTGNRYASKSVTISSVAKDLKEDEAVLSYSDSYMAKVGCGIGINKDASLLVEENHTLLNDLIKKHGEVEWDEVLYKVRTSAQMHPTGMEAEEFRTSVDLIGIIGINLNSMMQGGSTRGIVRETNRSVNYKAEMRAFNDVLYQLYIKPFEKILAGKKTIYISADVGTTLIAFEALQNEQGEYLGNLYNIIYVPSLTSRAILNASSKEDKKRMIAMGNPVYTKFEPHNMTGRAYDLSRSGMDNWNDLPGTEKELQSIHHNVPSAIIVDKDNLTESKIKALSSSGELAKYDILHFAVHGMVSMGDYRDNALILSENVGTAEDGFLQFNEITELHLNASLVCLSACETAAGIPADGEEVKNLPVAFFLAGARSVIATWWKIDDEATGIFMSSFYNFVFKENKSYPEALHLTRKKFIAGEFGEKFRAPYYWAAFKYFGY